MNKIVFENQENTWKNALPLGNGCFGAMAFYQKQTLFLPMNHYEIYYNIGRNVLPADQLAALPPCAHPGQEHRDAVARANRNRPAPGEPHYGFRLDKAQPLSYGVMGFSGSYPATGELRFRFADALKGADHRLELKLDTAAVTLTLGDALTLTTRIARQDAVLTDIHQTSPGLLREIELWYPSSRDRNDPEIAWHAIDDHTFAYEVTVLLDETTPFRFAGILHLSGASGRLESGRILLEERSCDIRLTFGVFTQWRYANPLQDGLAKLQEYIASRPAMLAEHKAYWSEFFSRARLTLPDKFLQRIYHINQYALDCSSGRDGVMKHHACGLNGLWDIRHPNLWGSMWYWDVNIQAAFAGVFSSNRLELGKVFSDGLLTYVELAKRWAKDVHDLPGAAMDYPYAFYYSTWPWCAQYLWQQYEYSQDLNYLKNDAYPLFLELCRFAVALFQWDEARGCYVVYPDVSPEQGPLTHNSVITVACTRYLLQFTLKAAALLDDHDPLLEDCRRLLAGFPDYPTVTDDYGPRLKDSEDAPANLWIRHPSMLMPLFPTGEVDLLGDARLADVMENTITFLEEHCEIGVFQVSWLAAAAARLGNGQKALRLLYEMGIDHLIRSNGLAAEENERFMNYCLVNRQPLYYPCMMEFTGEMLAAVNEMLLQSQNGILRLFPAMPDGGKEYDRFLRHGWGLEEYNDRCSEYPAWRDVRFDRLLARGAFEVSAERKDGALLWCCITSRVGGTLRITAPEALEGYCVYQNGIQVPAAYDHNILTLETVPGGVYFLSKAPMTAIPPVEAAQEEEILRHVTHRKRRISIGDDPESVYHKKLDSFLRDWQLGNRRMENHTVYKFDLCPPAEKDYSRVLAKQCLAAGEMRLTTMGIIQPASLAFTVQQGYGFASPEGVSLVRRDGPDLLRQDFAEGSEDAEFLIEAPAGQYELLAVCGDEAEESCTGLEITGGRKISAAITPAGRFACQLLPVIHEEDGCIRLKLSTVPGKKWKLNFLALNWYKSF